MLKLNFSLLYVLSLLVYKLFDLYLLPYMLTLTCLHRFWYDFEIVLVCLLVCVCVCASVCLHLRVLITSDVIWCDIYIDCVWLFKQILQVFPAFCCFIWNLPSIKRMGVVLLAQHVMNSCQRRLRWHGTSYRRTIWKMSTSVN